MAAPRRNRPQMLAALRAFYAEHGHTFVHRDHVSADGLRLGAWLRNQRSAARGAAGRTLTETDRAELEAINPDWLNAINPDRPKRQPPRPARRAPRQPPAPTAQRRA